MVLTTELNRGREVAAILVAAFNDPKRGIFGHVDMPEGEPPVGVERGSEEHIRFITLTVAIDYMKDAHLLWASSRKAHGDQRYKYLYDLRAVTSKDETIVAQDLIDSGLARYGNNDAKTWKTVSSAILSELQGDLSGFLRRMEYRGEKIIGYLRESRRASKFPYLKGYKIAPLWVRMLHDVCNVPIVDLAKLPIPVDVHIARATFTTGCAWGAYSGTIGDLRKRIEDYWFEVCKETTLIPFDLDEPLWNLSKFGCKQYHPDGCSKLRECPVGKYCVRGKLDVSQGEDGVKVDTRCP